MLFFRLSIAANPIGYYGFVAKPSGWKRVPPRRYHQDRFDRSRSLMSFAAVNRKTRPAVRGSIKCVEE